MKPSWKEGVMAAGMRVERLDHLGIVAGICREIGLAAYLDALAGPSQQQVVALLGAYCEALYKLDD
jgi:hypothetical protein